MNDRTVDPTIPSVEAAVLQDAEAIVHIQMVTWLDTYSSVEHGITREDLHDRLAGAHDELLAGRIEQWRDRIASPTDDRAIFVARIGERIVGYAGPMIVEGERRIGALYVLPEAQGKGIGGMLLRKAIDWHRQQAPEQAIFLHVVSYNQKAIAFYEKFGFVRTNKEVKDEVAQLPSGAVMPEIEMKLEP